MEGYLTLCEGPGDPVGFYPTGSLGPLQAWGLVLQAWKLLEVTMNLDDLLTDRGV